MANPGTVATEMKNPGPWIIPSGLKKVLIAFVILGGVTFLAGLKVDPVRTWASFVHNHFYFLSLGLGGLFFASIQWITGSMWSAPLRRLAEALTSYLPVVFLTFGLLYFGIPHLYLWSHASHVQGDLVLEGKSGYLNVSFFTLRNLLAIGLWCLFAMKMVGNSLAQDQSGEYKLTLKNRVLSPAFLALFAITFTMASFDQLMSLDPHWFSTMFGVYCFAGLFYSTLAAICLLSLYMISNGQLKSFINVNHMHDLGQFMFGFTVFWAYIGFSQFMLIWYANLPEETGYFIHRLSGGWVQVSFFLLVGKFMVPFLSLLPRHAKRNFVTLRNVAIFMLVAQWIDVMWMVQPEFFAQGPKFGWMEIGLTLGFLGMFGLAIARFLSRHSTVAIGDPRLAEAVFHHHL
ncbi:MAG: molybdopterin oxidoreductase [Bdellovibrionia bacterium]